MVRQGSGATRTSIRLSLSPQKIGASVMTPLKILRPCSETLRKMRTPSELALTACNLYMMTDQASWLIMEGCPRMRQTLVMPPSAKRRGRPSEHRSSKELTKRYALEGVKIASGKTGLVP
jgi:hypothetical protein